MSQVLRDLAALTVCVSPKLATEVKRRIHQFREALTELDLDAKIYPCPRGGTRSSAGR